MTTRAACWTEVIRFELRYQLRRKATWFFFVVFLVLLVGQTSGQIAKAQAGVTPFDAPIVLAQSAAWLTLIATSIVAAVAGDAATRDVEVRIDALMHASPLGRPAYLGGRFLGAFLLIALLLAAIPLAPLLVPLVDPGAVATGVARPAASLQSYFLVVLPNVFVTTALVFALATLVRHVMGAWIGGLLVAGVSLFSSQVLGAALGHWTLATVLDPAGATALHVMQETWTPHDVHARLIGLEPSLLMNRALWSALALAAIGVAYRRFGVAGIDASPRPARRRRGPGPDYDADFRPAHGGERTLPTPPDASRDFGRMAHVRQTIAVIRDSLRELVTGWTWLLIPGLVLLVLTTPAMLGHLGVPFVPTTDRVLGAFRGPTNDIRILLALLAGELVWRERDARMQSLADAVPVADGVRCVGTLLGLWCVTLALHGVLLAAGVLIQVGRGVHDFEPALYLQILFGLDLVKSLTFGLLALSVHVLVNHKHVGHLVLLLFVIAGNGLAAQIGIEHPLLVYGADPGWRYSRISGFDPFLRPVLLFDLYWAAWTFVLALIARLFLVRGVVLGFRDRLRLARQRLTKRTARIAATAFATALVVGGFIFYNTNVLNAYRSSSAIAERRAEYERRYKRYEGAWQPQVTATELDVELYPSRREADIRGVFTLANRTTHPISVIHVATSESVETDAVTFDRATHLSHHDVELRHQIHELDEPLAPGAAMRMTWAVRRVSRGFPARGLDTDVVGNGSFIQMQEWMPHIGYRAAAELTDGSERRRYGLPQRPETVSLQDLRGQYDPTGHERIDVKVTVGTAADQMAVAPGTLRRTWRQGDRRYFEYATNAPIGPGYAIFSAAYAVRHARAGDIALEIVHHPGHALNVDRMMRSLRASLEQYQKRFGPYPYDVLRMVEYPSSGGTLHAAAANIWYQELFSLFDATADRRGIDVPFAVVAHEVAHQFQPPFARVEGDGLLSETFAWYAALGVVEREYGAHHLRRFLDMMRLAYDEPRSRAGVPLLRASDWFDAYRRGPLAMYALQEYVGRDAIDEAWRRLIAAHRSGEPPFATSLDLYRELQGVTPDTLHGLLGDLLERNTFWELKTTAMTAQPIADGRWRVTLEVAARKTVVNENGDETEMPMDDPIEIGLYPEATNGQDRGTLLYLQVHRLRSGRQRLTVDAPGRPAAAVIDPRRLLPGPR